MGVTGNSDDVTGVTAEVTGTTGANTCATACSWAGETIHMYVHSNSKDLCPVLFCTTVSGMPVSKKVVVSVAHRL